VTTIGNTRVSSHQSAEHAQWKASVMWCLHI